ncbi:unnamed protein product [Pylaiella littoralis]
MLDGITRGWLLNVSSRAPPKDGPGLLVQNSQMLECFEPSAMNAKHDILHSDFFVVVNKCSSKMVQQSFETPALKTCSLVIKPKQRKKRARKIRKSRAKKTKQKQKK